MRHYVGVVLYVGLFGVLLLAPAGMLAWPRAWVLLGVLLSVQTIGTWRILRVNRALLDDRAGVPLRPDQPAIDKLLLPACMLSFAGLISFDGYDAVRLQLLGGPDAVAAPVGLVLFAAGWWLVETALRTNAYATTVIRHQSDRGHMVVSDGVYGYVRHPMYSGLIMVMVGMGVWLGTYAGALAALVPTGILIWRIRIEESVLRHAMPEYETYATRVRSRLIPGVW